MERVRFHSTTFKEPQPLPYWISDPRSHALFVDVPGFKREDLMVAVKKPRKVVVSGARPVSGNKTSHFMHEFDAPEDSEISQISARFDDGVLTIILPRKVTGTAEESVEQGSRENEIKEEKYQKTKPDHEKDWTSESDHEKGLYGPKKIEWERNTVAKDHGHPKEKEERDKNGKSEQKQEHELDHDLHKKEEEKGIEFELRPDQDLSFQKEKDQIIERNELELDQSLHLEKEKQQERSQIIEGSDLGIAQGLLRQKDVEERKSDPTIEESKQINDSLQNEMKEEEMGRILLIEAKEHGHDFQLEEGMRFIKIEGLGSIRDAPEEKTEKNTGNVLIERIANVDNLREGRRKGKGPKSKQGKKTEDHQDSGKIVDTPMTEEIKTTRDKKTVIVMALVALSIGFYWSHKILSSRGTESLK